mgnify:CR=1 FL=1
MAPRSATSAVEASKIALVAASPPRPVFGVPGVVVDCIAVSVPVVEVSVACAAAIPAVSRNANVAALMIFLVDILFVF